MKPNYADALANLAGNQLKDLVNARAIDIQDALDSAEDAKMSIGFTCKLTLVNGRLYSATSMRWSAVTKDETEGSVEVDDPTAPRLPGFQPVEEVQRAVELATDGRRSGALTAERAAELVSRLGNGEDSADKELANRVKIKAKSKKK